MIFQNNAEIRATVGNRGSGGAVSGGRRMPRDARTDRINVRSSTDRGGASTPELPAGDPGAVRPRLRDLLTEFSRTPNFPTAAQLFQIHVAAARKVTGATSGSRSIQWFFADIPRGGRRRRCGQVEVTADNAVKALLSDTYYQFRGGEAAADAFFTEHRPLCWGDGIGAWDPVQ